MPLAEAGQAEGAFLAFAETTREYRCLWRSTQLASRERREDLMKTLMAAVLALSVLAGLGVATAGGSPPDDLQAAKAATARYHSFQQALKHGYSVEGEPCVPPVPLPLPAMGIHAVNEALMADHTIDPLMPEILLYIPDKHGKLRLIGLEYWKADADQKLETSGDRPSLFGQPFDGPFEGHNPTMPVHYDLHVWLWEDNPSGLFAQFNPNLRCPIG
jgi:hypothetical protein